MARRHANENAGLCRFRNRTVGRYKTNDDGDDDGDDDDGDDDGDDDVALSSLSRLLSSEESDEGVEGGDTRHKILSLRQPGRFSDLSNNCSSVIVNSRNVASRINRTNQSYLIILYPRRDTILYVLVAV